MPRPNCHIRITGYGLITPLGLSAWQTFRALLEGKTLAGRMARMPETIHPIELIQQAGSVRQAEHCATDPSVELAERAAREALHMAGRQPSEVQPMLGVSKGAVHALTEAIRDPHDPTRFGLSPLIFDADRAVMLGPVGYLGDHLSRRLGLAPMRSVVAACASSLTALHHAVMRMQPGDKVLVLTSESALLPMFISSYARLGVLPKQTTTDYIARPLDELRAGFMLTELGAAVVLEATDEPTPIGTAELLSSAIATDCDHLIRTSEGLPALSYIADDLLADPVDMIHPHATGTVENDAAELAVYADRAKDADLYASKGAIGHALGASGLASLVIACLCAKTSQRPPMPWLDQPIDTPMPLQKLSPKKAMRTHAIFAAGFGGHTAGAVIRHV